MWSEQKRKMREALKMVGQANVCGITVIAVATVSSSSYSRKKKCPQ